MLLSWLSADPVLSNPGIPNKEYYEIWDYINKDVGFVPSKVYVELKQNKGVKYYEIYVWENSYYQTKLKINYNDLTTISEQRIDGKKKKVIEEFGQSRFGNVIFKNKDKLIDKYYHDPDRNYYSRYGYLISFRGFPFEKKGEVTFKSYMFEYPASALTLRLKYLNTEQIKVKAGKFNCYKLELSVDGWQGAFSKDKYYFYYTVAKPHYFVRFDQKIDTGVWSSNELMLYRPK